MAQPSDAQASGQEEYVQSLERRVDIMSKHLSEVHHLMRKERQLRWLTVVLILVIVGTLAYLSVHTVMNINIDEVSRLAQKRSPALMSEVQKQFQDHFEKAGPALGDKIQGIFDRHSEKLRVTTEKEVQTLVKNLSNRIGDQLNLKFGQVDNELQGAIRTNFPELSDEEVEKMGQKVREVIVDVGKRLVDEHLNEHVSLLLDIEKEIACFDVGQYPPNEKDAIVELKNVLVALVEKKLPRMLDVDSEDLSDHRYPRQPRAQPVGAKIIEEDEQSVPAPDGVSPPP